MNQIETRDIKDINTMVRVISSPRGYGIMAVSLAILWGVTKLSVHKWRAGKAKPQPRHEKKVREFYTNCLVYMGCRLVDLDSI